MGVGHSGHTVARGLGVKGHPSVILVPERAHGTEDPGMDGATMMWRSRLVDGAPGDLMAESQPRTVADEQSGSEEFVYYRRRARRRRFQQSQFRPGAGQRRDFKHGPTLGAETGDPRQDRVSR